MFDSLPGESGLFDFDDIANQLLEQGVDCSPSEIHGALVGILAAGADDDAGAGLDALNRALELDLHGELADQVMQLYAFSSTALQDDTFDFQPLLPDDDDELVLRTEALAQWCRGFLAGYARVIARAGTAGESLPGDSTEVLRDFAAMAQATADESDENDEEAENSYAELVEYLRFAALNIYMDSCARGDDRKRAALRKPGPVH